MTDYELPRANDGTIDWEKLRYQIFGVDIYGNVSEVQTNILKKIVAEVRSETIESFANQLILDSIDRVKRL